VKAQLLTDAGSWQRSGGWSVPTTVAVCVQCRDNFNTTRACSINQQAALPPFMPGYLGHSLKIEFYDIITIGDSKSPQKLFNCRRNAFLIGLPTRSQTISSTVAGIICKRAEPLALNRNHGPWRE
jgi:hypothetical protein